MVEQKEKTMSLMTKPVLLLDSSYSPLQIIAARRAMTMIVKGVAKAEETRPEKIYTGTLWDEHTGHHVTVDFYLPSVVRLLQYRYLPNRIQKVTRKNIFVRDNYTCMYCGKPLPAKKLTLDHIIPESKGGPGTWENLVSCCWPCNEKKGNKMLHELPNMKLIHAPRPINVHTSRHTLRNQGAEDPGWRKYLYYTD